MTSVHMIKRYRLWSTGEYSVVLGGIGMGWYF